MYKSQIQTIGEDGRLVLVIEVRRFEDVSNLSGHFSLARLSAYWLPDGRRVNKLAESSFQVVDTGEKLKRMS